MNNHPYILTTDTFVMDYEPCEVCQTTGQIEVDNSYYSDGEFHEKHEFERCPYCDGIGMEEMTYV